MKKLPHKSFISKMSIVAAVGLIASNLLSSIPYPVFAQEEWNTATYSEDLDGYTVTYGGKSYTVALSDQSSGEGYYRGFNENTINSEWDRDNDGVVPTYDEGVLKGNTNGLNDSWGGGSDTESNGYNPNPTNYDARQGPCDDGWHVPSRGEWNAIVTAWCHLDTNTCTESDLDGSINDYTLTTEFMSDFGMYVSSYWSSSPDISYGSSLGFFFVADEDSGVYLASSSRHDTRNIRCVKNTPNSAGGGSSSSALTWDEVESRSASGTLTDNPLTFIMPNHDVWLYAITAPNTYHVHYDGNGATAGTMTDSDYSYGTAGTLKPNAFSKTGYTWTGWNTQPNGGGTPYGSGATVLNWTATDGETIPIYAQWSVNGYEITYLLNSGTVSEANPDTYTIETATFTLHNPTRTNSTFLGWSGTNISGMTGTVTITQGSMGNRTYEANFACNTGYHLSGTNNCVNNTYDVVVENGDGTHGSADPVSFTYDMTGHLPTMPAQSGYDFVGWEVTGMSGGVAHHIGIITTTGDTYTYSGSTNDFMNLTIVDGGTVTLTALWEARNDTDYVVYHYIKDVNSDSYTLSGTDYRSGTTDTEVEFSTKLKTFTGFVYSGGYLTGGTTRPAGAGVTTGTIEKHGTLAIYLYYDRINYNVYLSGDAGISSLSGARAYEYGATVTVTATPKEGYHFVRWEKKGTGFVDLP